MIRESALITTLRIEQRKQVSFFEVRLPRATQDIIGVEMDFNWIDGYTTGGSSSTGFGGFGSSGGGTVIWTLPMTVSRNPLVGELKLQSNERPNICYTKELLIDKNIDLTDFSGEFFTPTVPTHRSKPEDDPVKISSRTTVLKGIFRDQLWQSVEGSYIYKVTLCIWVNEKEKTENKNEK